MKKNVIFADLTHTAQGIHSPTFPLGISLVMAYAIQELGREAYDYEIHKYPVDLVNSMLEKAPDILCLSNYCWNLELGTVISRKAREINPDVVIISGGPNFPTEFKEQKEFLKLRSLMDFYIAGEGELGIVALIRELEKNDYDAKKLKAGEPIILNTHYLAGEKLVKGPMERIDDINVIPSPYLMGIMDKFFDDPLIPIVETTRGCPFTCTYCSDGKKFNSKIKRLEKERVKEEIHYIGERIKNVGEMIISDLNFGMYKEDLSTAEYINEIQEKYGFPKVIGSSAGKNKPGMVIQVVEKLQGALKVGLAIQSADEGVLKNIKRSNISSDAYTQLLEHSIQMDKETNPYTEVILGLPGDSKETHYKSLSYGIENKAKCIRAYQAMMLIGTEMATPETRQKFDMKTKFRAIAGSVGRYNLGGEDLSIAEVDEIVVATNTLSFDDYLECRTMNLIIETFFNYAIFEEVFDFVTGLGGSVFDCLRYMLEHRDAYPESVRQIFEEYIVATRDDLFDTREEAIDFMTKKENTEKYEKGELGTNELLVHMAKLYESFDDITYLLFESIKGYLKEKGLFKDAFEPFLNQLKDYIIVRKSKFYDSDKVFEREFDFDFLGLDEVGYLAIADQLNKYEKKVALQFFHDEKQKEYIEHSMNVYINSPSGLGRLIQRSKFKMMFRRMKVLEKAAVA